MIKAVIFDFDGTLSNRVYNAYGVFNSYARKYFKDFSDIEFEAVLQDFLLYDSNGTIPVRLRLVPLMEKYGQYLPDTFVEDFTKHYYDYMYEFTILKDETIEVLDTLKGKYKLAILSNGQSMTQHNKIDAVGIAHYFDEIVVTGDYDKDKPDPEIFLMTAENLGVKPEECMMVGDVFCTDIIGAIKAGMKTTWIVIDSEKPSQYYHGYRVRKLIDVLDILKKES